MTLVDDLIAARAVIADHDRWAGGLWRGLLWTKRGRFCIAEAALEAAHYQEDVMAILMALAASLPRPVHSRNIYPLIASLVAFNTRIFRRHNDVLALFDRAINAARTPPTEKDVI